MRTVPFLLIEMKVFIFHGAGGDPHENWFPWLKEELAEMGVEALVPAFPTPEGQSLESWKKVMEQYTIEEDDILVGHSIAPALILRLLEKNKVKAAFLVAGFLGSLNMGEFDKINASFFAEPFDWEVIKNNCENIFVFGSDDDPYVPIAKEEELAEKLGVEPIVVEGAGHFNTDAGYTEFPQLLEKIKEVL